MSSHRRGSFRGRKRFYRDTFAPGGSKTDPLNIEIELTENPEEEKKRLGLLDPTTERSKKRKVEKDEKSEKPAENSPFKVGIFWILGFLTQKISIFP